MSFTRALAHEGKKVYPVPTSQPVPMMSLAPATKTKGGHIRGGRGWCGRGLDSIFCLLAVTSTFSTFSRSSFPSLPIGLNLTSLNQPQRRLFKVSTDDLFSQEYATILQSTIMTVGWLSCARHPTLHCAHHLVSVAINVPSFGLGRESHPLMHLRTDMQLLLFYPYIHS